MKTNIFTERLKYSRIDKELTQKAIALLLKVDQSSISDWERGKTFPSYIMLLTLCQILEVSADYLLGLEDETSIIKTAGQNIYRQIEEANDNVSLSLLELDLLKAFNRLSTAKQYQALGFTQALSDNKGD